MNKIDKQEDRIVIEHINSAKNLLGGIIPDLGLSDFERINISAGLMAYALIIHNIGSDKSLDDVISQIDDSKFARLYPEEESEDIFDRLKKEIDLIYAKENHE